MTLPDREKPSGLRDEVLAGEYVLGALSDEARAALARRIKTDRQFAATVRRWKNGLAENDKRERREFSDYLRDASLDHALRRPHDKLHRSIYGRFSIVLSLWNSARFWRLTTVAAMLWAMVLLFAVA
jgi:anti-sigma-K factor RskA